ncbi:hypothetical protein [Emcibacter sp.]|uniref:hypothetical protein n=1 Tax=Emcibacter sp. TaxID=1979954 RepID=UPI002AA73D9D|nr:hypothetical protein [Emcibacter sp.]
MAKSNEVEVIVTVSGEGLDPEAVQNDICTTLAYNLGEDYLSRKVTTALQISCTTEDLTLLQANCPCGCAS